MCGITGYLQFNKSDESLEQSIHASVKKLNRRGPDHQEINISKGMGLGHARLSIIDLTNAANQPMKDPSGRYSIVFNGEIFNFKDIREELNLNFQTSSDTEVLLAAYIKWKEDCLERLNGFFSFAIYDHDEHSLFLARDRFGMKPLLYAKTGDYFCFASELKSILEYPLERTLDYNSFHSFLQLSYIPSPFSIIDGVHKLKPGHYLKVSKQGIVEKQYYFLNHLPPLQDFEQAKVELLDAFKKSIQYWITSDAPLGAFLSGGVDSSIVVALASEHVSNLKTFSVSFPDSPFHDESPYSNIVAKRYATNHEVIPVTESNLFESVDNVLEYLDEPFGDSSAIPSFALCREVSKHLKVALSGDGADEVFGGYEKYRGEFLARKYGWASPMAKIAHPLTSLLPQSRDSHFLNLVRKGNRLINGIALNEEQRYWKWSCFNSDQSLRKILNNSDSLENWKEGFFGDAVNQSSGINRMILKDISLVLEGDMLTKVDMMSMANSIEVRPIFLDHHIVDLANRIPGHFKVTQAQRKKILIETFKDYLPKEVYTRPKHGFSVELLPFFRTKYWEKINDVFLSDSLIQRQGLFNLKAIQNLKKSIKEGNAHNDQSLIWSLITFQNFWLKFNLERGL